MDQIPLTLRLPYTFLSTISHPNHRRLKLSSLRSSDPHWLLVVERDHAFFGSQSGIGDGQGGLACCDSWGRKESDMTEWLN